MDHTQYMKEFKIKQKTATTRMGHLPIEGGGLNAGYDTVDTADDILDFTERNPFGEVDE